MKDDNIFYSLSTEDIQNVSSEQLHRDLTSKEIERIKEMVPERIAWYDIIADVIREEIEALPKKNNSLKSAGILKQSTDKVNTKPNTATQFPGIDNSKVIVSSPNMIKENSQTSSTKKK